MRPLAADALKNPWFGSNFIGASGNINYSNEEKGYISGTIFSSNIKTSGVKTRTLSSSSSNSTSSSSSSHRRKGGSPSGSRTHSPPQNSVKCTKSSVCPSKPVPECNSNNLR